LSKLLLLTDYDGSEYTIDTPLTSKVNLEEIKKSLNIPTFVDKESYPVERALVTIWGAAKSNKIHELYPDVEVKNLGSSPIPLLLFGGAAIRMHSQSSNQPGSPFFRKLNDVDFIVPGKRSTELIRLLIKLGDMFGTRYYHFLTTSDRGFNARRSGLRYRIRTIDRIAEDGTPIPGLLDILVDSVDMRHKVDVREDFKNPSLNSYTISLENLLLTKLQYIFDMPSSVLPSLTSANLEYRVLKYPYLKSDRIVLGMEEKDIRDVCALLMDNTVRSDETESINVSKISRVLHDKKFALTVRLNLQNILERPQILESWNISKNMISKIQEAANEILKAVPTVDKKWDEPWWDTDVETPEIFSR
jgi:hypothetical protein